ncbi:hypothetical protein [Clostridium sp. D53t1_180928_C8]|uniref:DUF6906 family protein n=1 Tax=Clostridium sp. D53t1_180928_C8 TaxID=2787101 RepID=UPI0018A8900B|nr:hypothetical protein [Clostridium sp. D53t1_180928_C8]
MKSLKKLTREQKTFLQRRELNSDNYLLERATTKEYVFFNNYTKELEVYER